MAARAKTYQTRPGEHPSIQVNVIDELPQDRFVLALARLRTRIAGGLALVADDSDAIGDKYTTCSWGLCSEAREAWPDAQDHLFPVDFERRGRVTPLPLQEGHLCPMDRRTEGDGQGCFYTCRVFSPLPGEPRPTREQALALFDTRLQEVRA